MITKGWEKYQGGCRVRVRVQDRCVSKCIVHMFGKITQKPINMYKQYVLIKWFNSENKHKVFRSLSSGSTYTYITDRPLQGK